MNMNINNRAEVKKTKDSAIIAALSFISSLIKEFYEASELVAFIKSKDDNYDQVRILCLNNMINFNIKLI